MDIQFYPTPKSLAHKMWNKFNNKNFLKILEPQAGEGDLALSDPWGYAESNNRHYHRTLPIDCCEIDVSKHAILRAKGLNVVGVDFLEFGSAASYSHIIMNPPFENGEQHVLKAWDTLWNGEISACINAQSIRNPNSYARRKLIELIDLYGSVEYVEGAFEVEDAIRKASVDVALVYLHKQADADSEIYGDIIAQMSKETNDSAKLIEGFEERQEVALPNTTIENAVVAFNAAMRTMKESVFAETRAKYYRELLGDTLEVRSGNTGKGAQQKVTIDFVQGQLGSRYEDLKNRAWTCILHSSKATALLSSKGRKMVESEFESIKKLEFTVQNIYAFLQGLAENQGDIQIQMALDVFDSICKQIEDNTELYRTWWKSNGKHRACGMRIKMSRFVLPRNTVDYGSGINHDALERLRDIDKVMAMLDGKRVPEVSLVETFEKFSGELKRGQRLRTSYFDVRWYPGVGTIHFYPTDKKLIERFNRIVGQHRKWLPAEGESVNAGFWEQYEHADKFQKEFNAEMTRRRRSQWDDPRRGLFSRDDDEKARVEALVDEVLTGIQEKHGISADFLLGGARCEKQLLLTA